MSNETPVFIPPVAVEVVDRAVLEVRDRLLRCAGPVVLMMHPLTKHEIRRAHEERLYTWGSEDGHQTYLGLRAEITEAVPPMLLRFSILEGLAIRHLDVPIQFIDHEPGGITESTAMCPDCGWRCSAPEGSTPEEGLVFCNYKARHHRKLYGHFVESMTWIRWISGKAKERT